MSEDHNTGQAADDHPTSPPPDASKPSSTRIAVIGGIALLAGLLLGIGLGGDDAAEEPSDDGELTAAQDDLAELEAERDTLAAQVQEQQREIDQLTTQLAEAREAAESAQVEPESEPEPEPEERPQRDRNGTYTAGSYRFEDVQLGEDFAGDLEIRARVTNTGDDVSGVAWTATVFSGGSVVATADGNATEFAGGDTITVEFYSTDDFPAEWDELEFQVDAEF